jgi:ribosomal protein S18 acetylase RimI-like enzyme
VKIRSLTISDYDQIVALWRRAGLPFRPQGRDDKEAIKAQMRTNPGFFLGAFVGRTLIGVVVVTCDGRKGWINRLAVDPDYRRKGVATALAAEAEKTLRRHGMRIFCALIDGDNTKSIRLFEKCGYVEHRDIVYFSKRDSDQV